MSPKLNLFEFTDYRKFFLSFIKSQEKTHGFKSVVAEKCGVQLAYLSNVLNEKSDLNIEQAYQFCQGLRFSENETQYFILLVQYARAGNGSLKKFFLNQIQDFKHRQQKISARLEGDSKVISDEFKNLFYSSWIYAAVQVALTLPELKTPQHLAQHFKCGVDHMTEILNELEVMGLVRKNLGVYETTQWIKLGQDSKNLIKHHTNWRLQAIQEIDKNFRENLHFSACYSLSQQDALDIQETLSQKIKSISQKVRTSNEEVLYAFVLDFWKV